MQAHPQTPLNPACPSLPDSRPGEDAARETLCWVTRPAGGPLRIAGALAAVSITWWLALWAFGNPLFAGVACLALMGAVAEGLFPVHHRITPTGVSTRCAWQMRAMGWSAVRSVRSGADGVHISPLTSASRLSRLRGVKLRFSDDNRHAVLDAVHRYWKGSDRPSQGTPV
ncbi:MAG TPA: hypothetical protein VGM37_02970 [Armatimonadota bacterium]|jgi:hypothetical protein